MSSERGEGREREGEREKERERKKTRSTEKKKRFEEVHPNRGPQSCGLCRAGEGWAGQRLRQAG